MAKVANAGKRQRSQPGAGSERHAAMFGCREKAVVTTEFSGLDRTELGGCPPPQSHSDRTYWRCG